MEHVIDILLGVMLGMTLSSWRNCVWLEDLYKRIYKSGRKAVNKYIVHYELRTEDDDSILEKGEHVVEAERDYAFSAAAKMVLDGLKGRNRAGVYVACVAVQEAK